LIIPGGEYLHLALKKEFRGLLPALTALKAGPRSDPERPVLLYLGREKGGLSLKDLVRYLKSDGSSVRRTAGRVVGARRAVLLRESVNLFGS
jgi:hypothetical protein